jgi:cis-3-alkyl-4-acyloxetan-2-one decarboxylase
MVTPDTALPAWLSAQYPFRPHLWRTLRGARLHYVDEGPQDRDAFVFVHGNPTWSFYYRRLIQALSTTYRCVAPDHIGMGLSDKPQHYPYTLAQRIQDLDGLLSTLRLARIHLVVHDWGGAIGLGWAARNASRLASIHVLNTGAFRFAAIPKRIALCKDHPFGTFLVRGLNGFSWPATRMTTRRRSLTGVERRAYLFPHASWHDRVAVNAFVKDIPLKPQHPSMPELTRVEHDLPRLATVPLQFIWGGADWCFDTRFLKRFQDFFPKAPVTLWNDVGHYVLEDAPDQTLELIRNFAASAG